MICPWSGSSLNKHCFCFLADTLSIGTPLSNNGGMLRSGRCAEGLVGDGTAETSLTGDKSSGRGLSGVEVSPSILPRSKHSSLLSGDASGSGNLVGDAVGSGSDMSFATVMSLSKASEGRTAGSVFACTALGRCKPNASEADLKCFFI